MKSNNGVIDWRKLEPTAGGDPLSPDWFTGRRQELEAIVGPLVTTRKTNDIVEFRGKRRYLTVKPINPNCVGTSGFAPADRPALAILALQFLYRMESARAAGDVASTINLAIAFARADTEVQNQCWFGEHSVQMALGRIHSKQTRTKTRLGKTKLRDVPDILLQSEHAKHVAKHDWLQQTTRGINRHLGNRQPVSSRTVGNELRKRGIVE